MLQAEGERAFSNFSGDKRRDFVGVSNFSGMDGLNYRDELEEIIIDILNTDEANDLAAPIFGANEGFVAPFNGLIDFITGNTATAAKGIIIQPQGYTLNELREKSKTSPFLITGMRYDFGDDTQLKQPWQRRRKEGTEISSKPYNPQGKRSLTNNIATVLDDPDFTMKVDAKTTLFVRVAKAISASVPRKIQLLLKVGTEVDIANALKGQSVVTRNGY